MEDRLSVWFTFVARQTGSLALDACLLSTSPAREHPRVLNDRPLSQAAVLAEGLTAAEERHCVPLVLEVRAGERYRMQATARNGLFSGDNGTVALRGRMLGTPPAVTEFGLEYASASESSRR